MITEEEEKKRLLQKRRRWFFAKANNPTCDPDDYIVFGENHEIPERFSRDEAMALCSGVEQISDLTAVPIKLGAGSRAREDLWSRLKRKAEMERARKQEQARKDDEIFVSRPTGEKYDH